MEFKKLFPRVNIYIIFSTPAHLSANFIFISDQHKCQSRAASIFKNLGQLGSSFSPECRFGAHFS
jgi:hypothetical protein